MGRRIFLILNALLFRYALRVTVHHNPAAQAIRGGLVIASNHLGFLDGFLVYHATWRSDVIVIIAEHWREHAWSRLLARAMDAIFVDRYNADIHAVREVMRRLRAGGMLCVAPEGTRSPTGALIRPHGGAAYLAMKAGVPVVPAAITGTEDRLVFGAWKRLRRPQITLTVGEPIPSPPLPQRDRDQAIDAFTEEIMVQIAALLPAHNRGIYADHPRLHELLERQPITQPFV